MINYNDSIIRQIILPGGEDAELASELTAFTAADFCFVQGKVQGAEIGRTGKNTQIMCVKSPRRFKITCTSKDTVYFYLGRGFIKWKKGEKPFSEGQILSIENAGEYEINGACEFIINKSEV